MKRICIVFLLMILASCGFSKGEDVQVIPNDSMIRSQAWHGTFEKSDGDTAVINRDGKFVTVPSNEVFSARDEEAIHIRKARGIFIETYKSNIDELSRESIRELVIEKAYEAQLNDWVAFLELLPRINEFNKRVANNNASVDDLNDAWGNIFDDFSDLEEQVSYLTNPKGDSDYNGNYINFSTLIGTVMKSSVTDAIANTYAVSDTPSLEAWKKSLEKAFELVPTRVNEEKHKALLIGKILTDAELDKVRVSARKKILSDTLSTSIKIGTVELGENTASTTLLNFLIDKLPYTKNDLVVVHEKKSWDELLAAIQAVDKWASILTSDHWNGEITIHRRYYRNINSELDLKVFFKDSLLKPIAEMTRSDGSVLKGSVSKSENGIQIKDKLGNWNWQGHIDDEGALAVSGNYPLGSYVYKVNIELHSLIAMKKIELARLAEEKRIAAERAAEVEKLKAAEAVVASKPAAQPAQGNSEKKQQVKISSPVVDVKPVVKKLPASVPSQAKKVVKHKTSKVVHHKAVKSHSNALSKSDSKKLNQAIDSLKALL